jgi:glycosyltransferase involved in cell wall biosynthesis
MTIERHTFPDTTPASGRPRVSVISTFFNSARFIAEAVESVLAQDFPDFELILVDDGSVDGSTRIAAAYAARHAPRVRCIHHPGRANRGISASRNLGVAAARGELLAFIDSDDLWDRSKLTGQIAIMDAQPELGMVCGAARYWRSWDGGTDTIVATGHVANAVVDPPEAALALYPLGHTASPCPSDLLLRRDVVIALGGFEEHFSGPRQLYEDQAFLAKLYLAAPVYFSDRVWINYREHHESCIAQVLRDGRYHEVRLYFLNWLEHYLTTVPGADLRVRAAVRRRLWQSHHPLLHAARRPFAALRRA